MHMKMRILGLLQFESKSFKVHRSPLFICFSILNFKGALSGLKQFLATESSLNKNDENAFYFTSKAAFVLKIFMFLSWLFGHVAKRLVKKDKVNFKYDATALLTNNRNTHIAQYFEK